MNFLRTLAKNNKQEQQQETALQDEQKNELVIFENSIEKAKNQIKSWEWFNPKKKEEGLGCIQLLIMFYEEGHIKQAKLQLKRLEQVTFEDYMEGNEIACKPVILGNSHSYKKYSLEDFYSHVPVEALKPMQKVKEFPFKNIVGKIEIWDAVKKPDPLLVVKVAKQWYCICIWEISEGNILI